MAKKKYDFGGYATRINLLCSDGRTIRQDAFKHNDGKQVPLVWNHDHSGPENILGHAILEHRADGLYAYCMFNDSEAGKNTKVLVEHGDITDLSIHANQLKQKGKDVLHGDVKEVSVVLAGANPGAFIDNLEIMHGDAYVPDESDAVIYTSNEDAISLTDVEFEHADKPAAKNDKPAAGKEPTIEEVYNTLNDDQKTLVHAMIAMAVGDDEEDPNMNHSDEGGKTMKRNVFEGKDNDQNKGTTLTHAQISAIFSDAQEAGSFKKTLLEHAATYGIEDIDILFPDAKTITNTPDFIKRRTQWVDGVISGTHHTPFSRIKSTAADITADAARAKGYVKGTLKKEEVITLLKRTTGPTTIYKKQKLDRDDILDITDFDVVAWLKAEMRLMLDEELARAILVGDGRTAASEDKIKDPAGAADGNGIRSIYLDNDMYAHHIEIPTDATVDEEMEAIVRAMEVYEGSGGPTFYTTQGKLNDMLLQKDTLGYRIYKTETEVAAALGVSKIEKVPVMKGLVRTLDDTLPTERDVELVGIIVNLQDYSLGADKGGQVSMFDDFDIDYNQQKYLIETRCSGALKSPKTALVIEKVKTVAVG